MGNGTQLQGSVQRGIALLALLGTPLATARADPAKGTGAHSGANAELAVPSVSRKAASGLLETASPTREDYLRATAEILATLKTPHIARMSACTDSKNCSDATLYLAFPGKIDIRYDKPYGSRVVSEGRYLATYHNDGRELDNDELHTQALGALVRGPKDKGVEVLSIHKRLLGANAEGPKERVELELRQVGEGAAWHNLTMIFDLQAQTLLGWRVSDSRSTFEVSIRDLRPLPKTKKPRRLFQTASLTDR